MNVTATNSWNSTPIPRPAQPASNGFDDLKAALNDALPGVSVAFGELPKDQATQQKLAMAGKLAGLTIAPEAAARMQSDSGFRDKVIAGVKADQEANPIGKTTQVGNLTAEIVGHGTVVDKDGNINGWTLSKATDSTGSDDDDKAGKTDKTKKKSLLEAIKDRLKELQEKNKLSKDDYDATMKEADEMAAAGKSEDEIAAKLREAYLANRTPSDSASVGIETTV